MKKALLLILATIMICLGFLLTHFFKIKEMVRVNNIESSFYTTSFYIRESSQSPKELLSLFEQLSKQYHVSIVKTDFQDNDVVKSGVFDEETFPVSNLGLNHLSFKNNPDGIYTNVSQKDRLGSVSVFLNAKTVRIQQLSTYLKNHANSINGSYTITSTLPYSKEAILNDISAFLGVTSKELTEQKMFVEVGYVNKNVIITVIILIILVIMLLLGIFIYPLTQMKSIGIMKTLGYSNLAIFIDYLKPQILTLILTSFIMDFCCSFLKAKPQYYLMSLVWSQCLVFLLFSLLSLLVFSLIQTITISAMLRGFNNYKAGEYIGYTVKLFMIGVVAVVSLIAIPNLKDLASARANYTLWHKYASHLVTIEAYKLDDQLNNAMVSNTPSFYQYFAKVYTTLEKEIGAYYIRYDTLSPSKLPIMSVNHHYLQSIDLPVEDDNTDVRLFLVPERLRSQEKGLKEQLSQYAISLLPYEQQEKVSVPIKINYYSQKKTVFSFSDVSNQQVTNPIFLLVTDHLAYEESAYLATTGLNSPIKFKNTNQNLAEAESVASLGHNGTDVKWSSLSSIAQTNVSSLEDGLKNLLGLAGIFVVLNLAVSYFLATILLRCKHQYLNTTRLLGWRLYDRFKLLFSLLLVSYCIPLCILVFLTPSLIVVALFGLYSIFDLSVLMLLISRSEKKLLADNLKRGEV
ncbi:hypothetical protein [Streptococcus sciuri]|uniref:DUF1430 domain-containing protein n=1 Tax=Streptococcus sciuri TaxID=2973939 RepID=A0ABT2F7U4_9STRE|nr:hypothetical protein [Streptococcus sciuri]MCS4488479.1 hypothetical protein [Streptococcus sciuri]